MSRDKRSILPLALIVLVLAASPASCKARNQNHCNPSSCGNIQNISYPFRLKADPTHCGEPRYELSCENNRTILNSNSRRYYVQEICYDTHLIRLVDPGLDKANCSSFPINILEYDDLYYGRYKLRSSLNTPLLFISCAAPAKSPIYHDIMKFCGNSTPSNFLLSMHNYSYILVGDDSKTIADVEDNCTVNMIAWVSNEHITSLPGLYVSLAYGFLLDWSPVHSGDLRPGDYSPELDNSNVTCNTRSEYCDRPTFKCRMQFFLEILFEIIYPFLELGLAGRFVLGIPFLLALVIYKKRRSHLSMYVNIEEFLQGPNDLMPVRYAYSDIKKMTNNFSNKLGEGGFGTVFKGKLRSGPLVAVKLLGKSKDNGQEFISEVATVGRIHHANVVKLIGFCFESSKRALVYEFMPNGSLNKYIFLKEAEAMSLSCEKSFAIALGVARGIDYLHRGCEMQILHFDIKPHNILLDEQFTPKLSDFGLAKLYPTENSIVSLTAARGTLGYMAPELYYKNIGGVSHKADIYSYQVSKGKNIEMGDASNDERKIVKKMILVALWCIQMKPTNRPSMNKVIEMLEGDGDLIEMPPKPFQSPQEMLAEDDEFNAGTDDFPLLSADRVDSGERSTDIVNNFSWARQLPFLPQLVV